MSLAIEARAPWRRASPARTAASARVVPARAARSREGWLDLFFTGACAALVGAIGFVNGIGRQPLGALLVAGAALLATVLLGQLLLRELGVPRTPAVAIPLLVALAGIGPAEMLCVLALWADLRAARGRSWARLWRLVSVPALLAAGLASASVVPLLVLGELLVWSRTHRNDGRRRVPLQLGPAASTLAAAAGGMRLTASAAQGLPPAGDLGRTLETHVAAAVTSLPVQAAAVVQRSLDWWPVPVAALAIGLAIGWYLWRIADPELSVVPRRRWWLALTLLGLAVLGAGDGIAVATTGAGVALGAGIALSVLGGAGVVAGLAPTDLLRREALAVLAALLCTTGIAASTTSAARSLATYLREQAVAGELQRALPHAPAHSVLLIEPACAGGPAASSDPAAVLEAAYHDPSIQGAMLTGAPVVEEDGLSVRGPGAEAVVYVYGDLYVYNEAQRHVYRLGDAREAARYFMSDAQGPAGCARARR